MADAPWSAKRPRVSASLIDMFNGGSLMKLREHLKLSCGAIALVLGGVVPAHAQDAAVTAEAAPLPAEAPGSNAAEADAPAGEIVVTGSRIKRDSFDTATPTITVGAEELRQRGKINVLDILNEVPALRGSFGLEFTGGQADIGVQRANLRGLSTHRSLVVVNNRRRVSTATEADARGFVASSFDISNIPSALIERVDVVTGGASSVYGSDAISGAINLVLKQDFEGIEAGGTVGTNNSGSQSYYQAYVTAGMNFDRGNAVFHVEHSYSDRLKRSDIGGGYSKRVRNNAAAGQALIDPSKPADAWIYLYNDAVDISIPGDSDRTMYVPWLRSGGGGYTGFFHPIDRQGNVMINPATGLPYTTSDPGYTTAFQQRQKWGFAIYDPKLGKLRAADLGSLGAISSFECAASSGCEIEAFDYDVVVPNKRTNLYGALTYELTDNIKFSGEFIYSRSFSSRMQNPSDPGIFYPAGFEPASELFVDVLDANGAKVGDIKSPFFTQAFIDQIYQLDPSYNPLDPSFVDDKVYVGVRQLNEHGPRLNTYERDYISWSGGLKGELSNGWSWEAFYDWGRSSLVWTRFNDHEDRRLVAATDIVFDQATGKFECRDKTWRAEGCVPADLINGISPEAVKFMTFNDVNVHSMTQQMATLFLTGDSSPYFTLPAGAVKFAIGAEWRRNQMKQAPGNGFVRGTTYGGEQRPRFNISTSVKEAYGELVIPVLKDTPFFRRLELEGGIRYTEQSTGKSDLTWKLGGSWEPVRDIRLRAMFARAARSPSGSELYQPTTRTYSGMVDPCDTSQYDPAASNNETRITNCMAILGLSRPDTLAFNGRPSNVASQAGNGDLKSEVANTLTLGAIFAPRFVPGLTFSVDYYNIKIKDLIADVGVQSILDNCALSQDGVNSQFCKLVERDAASKQIQLVTNAGVNIHSQQVSGIDIEANYRFDLRDAVNMLGAGGSGDLGSVGFRVTSGIQLKNEYNFVDPTTGTVETDDDKGEYFAPTYTQRTQLTYNYNNLSLFWGTFWVKSTKNSADIRFPSVFYNDASISYDIPGLNATATFGVDNIFNVAGRRHAFTCCSPGRGSLDRGFDSRRFSLGLRVKLGGKDER